MATGMLTGAGTVEDPNLTDNTGAVTQTDPTNISQQAQDVAKAQGVAYEDIGKTQMSQDPTYADYNAAKAKDTISSNVNVKSGLDYVDQNKSTVSGQLTSLLSQDNPYIQQARLAGKESAAQRGMLSSSMAAGAAEREAIKAALPIAQQDAQTYASAQQAQQQTENQMQTIQAEAIVSSEIVKQQAQIDRTNQNIQNAFESAIQGANAQNTTWLEDLRNSYNVGMQELTHSQNLILQQEDISAQRAESVRQLTGQIMQNYQISVENMMTDPDFLNLGSAAVNNAINQMHQLAKNSVGFIGAASGMEDEINAFIEAYMGDITVM